MSTIPKWLIEKLRHPDLNERSQAVFELDRMDDADKLPVLIDALRTEPDRMVREDITFAIMHLGKEAVSSLIDLLQVADAQARHHAAHVLGKIAHVDAVDALIHALQDEDSSVVMKAAVALNQIGDIKALPALVNLLGHENREVQTTLTDVLSQFGESAVPYLLKALQHESWQIRARAADVLGVIGASEAAPALIAALQDDHWQVRFSAVTALGYLGGKEAKVALQNMQDDPEPRVSGLIERVLEKMPDVPPEPSPISDYHRISFADVNECSAFIAGLSRFLNNPQGTTYRSERGPVEVWTCSPDLKDGIDVYLSQEAFNATLFAFGEAPVADTRKGDTFSENCAFILGGQHIEAWGLLDAKRHLLKTMLRR